MDRSFDVFLSHNSKDKPTVRQLAQALQGRGLKVWLDEWELVPGRPWQEALEEIIQTTHTAAVLVGKDGLGPWEIPEMRACLSQFVKRRLPVIPILLPDAPTQPELPLFLQEFTWVDLCGGLTDDGLNRLEWGITGSKPGPLLEGQLANIIVLSSEVSALNELLANTNISESQIYTAFYKCVPDSREFDRHEENPLYDCLKFLAKKNISLRIKLHY